MYFSEVVTLQKIKYTQDANAYTVAEVESERNVFAERHSLARGEFYGATQAGITTSEAFKIRSEEYDGETYLKYNGKTYKIVRTYDAGKGIIDLTCSDAKAV